ncbi:unnamed protein product [Lepeophtheirus salmonis]|uniref:(salmon louse) hypothetical protein n=1 Tax=Lepeophtheirus salmonis TaxID=72036 RepID=A0A7R8CZU7_LEPSM|nr:unnamed protein product [Lepeophtheirus salmonis]CAF2953606.1 unnamed protein product [Lepeophtheirus salmonis]
MNFPPDLARVFLQSMALARLSEKERNINHQPREGDKILRQDGENALCRLYRQDHKGMVLAINKEVSSLLEGDAITPVQDFSSLCPKVCSSIFAVKRKDKIRWRVINNLKPPNRFIVRSNLKLKHLKN